MPWVQLYLHAAKEMPAKGSLKMPAKGSLKMPAKGSLNTPAKGSLKTSDNDGRLVCFVLNRTAVP